MIAIIYAGLSILPLGLLIFGSLFLKTRFKNLNVPVILSVGLVTLICEFLFFNSRYAEAIDFKLWNALGSVISYFPILASITVFSVCGIIFSNTEIFKYKNKNHFLKLFLFAFFCVLALRIISLKNQDTDFLKTITMLSKPETPQDVLQKYADMDHIDYKLAVIGNKNIPEDLILKLSQSENEMVRFYSTANPKLSNERLQDMKTNDVSKEVRQQAENELKFNRLAK